MFLLSGFWKSFHPSTSVQRSSTFERGVEHLNVLCEETSHTLSLEKSNHHWHSNDYCADYVCFQACHVFVFCFTIYFSCRNGQTRTRVMKTYERHQDRHSHTDSTYPHYHKLYKPFMNDCMSEIEIDVLVPKMLFSFPCPNIWFRRRSIKMVGQHKCAMARKAVIRYTTISETLMMGKIEISSTAWFVSLNRDKKSRILVHWSLSHD